MKKRFHDCIFLWIFNVILFRRHVQGLTCFNCKDVSSPNHCQETTQCGQGETCSAREFVDHRGLRGFRLGCGDYRTCELAKAAHTLFGKRRALQEQVAHHDRCYACCLTDECNADLCAVSTTHPPPSKIHDMVCMTCEGVESPEHCRQTSICGHDEMCFTREYRDQKGLRGFRLGCENKSMCRLLLDAKTLMGKRNVAYSAPDTECFECCSTDECNTRLCLGPTGITPTSVTTSVPSSERGHDCPAQFVPFKENCYLFEHEGKTWCEAKSYCESKGGNPTSITSSEEQDFLTKEMIKLDVGNSTYIWTGGYYSHQTSTWLWMDGSPFSYSLWDSAGTPSSYTSTTDYRVQMINPIRRPFEAGVWDWASNMKYVGGVICKRKQLM